MKIKLLHLFPLLFFVFILVSPKSGTAQRTNEPLDHPNVLFIVVDDMNKFFLTDYPATKAPALKKLASQSYNFENASCAAPVCIPSRASFFSGMYPHHSGVYRNSPDVWNTSHLLTQVEAIPELFKRNGYTTWAGGKTFHLPLPGTREEDMFDNEVFHGGYGPYYGGKGSWFNIKAWEGPDSDFTDVVNADSAIAFLGREQAAAPFFMYFGLYRPHTPYTAPKRFHEQYEGVHFPPPPGYLENDLADVPQAGKDQIDNMRQLTQKGTNKSETLQAYLKAYCANISFADWNVGRVLAALDNSPYADNTIVIFAGDNGFHNGSKNHWTKTTLWEQADAVPLMIRLPERKAFQCTQTVSLIDIYPTLVEYCGLKPPTQALDGLSLVPVFKNANVEWSRNAFTSYGEKSSSVRSQRYRYIRYPDGSEELYDHQTDPYEHTNLAGNAEMESVIDDLARSIPDKFQKSVPSKKEISTQKESKPAKGKKAGEKKKRSKK